MHERQGPVLQPSNTGDLHLREFYRELRAGLAGRKTVQADFTGWNGKLDTDRGGMQ
jgi:hypothetical protein